MPSLMDRRTYEVYAASDNKGLLDSAREKARKILAEHKPLPLPDGAQKAIDAVVERALKR
jgi:trimethylamine:corrinoid methyltransferase-like protein